MTNYGIVKKIEQIEAQGYWHNDLFNSIWIDIVQWVLFLKIILTPLVKKIRNVFDTTIYVLGLNPYRSALYADSKVFKITPANTMLFF